MICRTCDKPFEAPHFNARFCSDECRRSAKRDAARRWRRANKELANQRTAEWYQRNLDREREKGRAYHRSRYTQETRVRLHGMELIQFKLIWDEQGGRCAVCQEPFREIREAHIDHDHACCKGSPSCGNCVRGLLCNQCNLALGHMKDSPRVAVLAARYLARTMMVPHG